MLRFKNFGKHHVSSETTPSAHASPHASAHPSAKASAKVAPADTHARLTLQELLAKHSRPAPASEHS